MTMYSNQHGRKNMRFQFISFSSQETERKHAESANEIESQKLEIEKRFEALKEEEEKLRKNVELLEEDNKRLKLLSKYR